MSGLFCIANLLELGKKKYIFLILWILTPFKPNEVKYFIINVKKKVSYKNDNETRKKPKSKKNYN